MKLSKKQSRALGKAFNDKAVQNMKSEEYEEYIQQICALSLSTIIANKGPQFTKEFVEAALNNTEPTPIVQQSRTH